MAEPVLTYGDYLKAAFWLRVRLPLLGRMPANQMALGLVGLLGLINPGFWLLGAAAELGYLAWLSSNDRFQKLVRAERRMGVQEDWESRVLGAVERLSPASRERYDHLLAECRRVLGMSVDLDASSLGGVRDLRSNSLNQLLWIFLRLLRSRELIEDNVAGVDRQGLEADVQRLEARIAEVDHDHDAALARSLVGTLDIQRRRLANLERAAGSLGVIEAELDRIEQHVELIREEAAVSGKTEALSTRLDAVTDAMSETNRWMTDNAELFGSLGAGEELAGSVSDLPRAVEGSRALEEEG